MQLWPREYIFKSRTVEYNTCESVLFSGSQGFIIGNKEGLWKPTISAAERSEKPGYVIAVRGSCNFQSIVAQAPSNYILLIGGYVWLRASHFACSHPLFDHLRFVHILILSQVL